MIVRNVARGRSFKKLAAYLTQPKEGQHRALWHSVENVGCTDPRTAAKIMAAVDLNADALKAAAGVGNGGRKAKDGPVYHVVMSWAEGQQPSQAHQLEAARDMLKTIGLSEAQALIVAHNDNGKEHLHLMVNLVDPETGKRLSLSNDRHKMQEWALDYERKNGGVIIERRANNAEAWAKGEAQAKGDRIPRAAMDKSDRAQRKDWQAIRAEREAAYTRQRDERGAMRAEHGAQWSDAKREAAQHRAAYKEAFRAAYAKAKAEDKAAHKPTWKAVFLRQKAESGAVERAVVSARATADQARKIAAKAAKATATAERRSASLIGKVSQRLGLALSPDQAQARQLAASDQMQRAALGLAQAELTKAGLSAKHEGERRAIGKQISEGTYAKAQLAVDTMPRSDFAAMIRQQDAQRAALTEQHNAERKALGMKVYDPANRGVRPMTPQEQEMKRREDQARQGFGQAADRRQTREQIEPAKVQGAAPTLRPDGTRGIGTTPAAPLEGVKERAAAKAQAEQGRTSFKGHELNPRREGETKPRSVAEIMAERKEQGRAVTKDQADKAAKDFAKANQAGQSLNRAKGRDDFER